MGGSLSSRKIKHKDGNPHPEKVREFRAHMYSLSCIRVFGDVIVTASEDRTVKIWRNRNRNRNNSNNNSNSSSNSSSSSSEDGYECVVCEGHSHWVTCLELDADDGVMYSAGLDKTMRAWNFETGECLHVYSGHKDWIVSLSLLDRNVITASEDGTVKCWSKFSKTETLDLCVTWNSHVSAVKAMIMTSDRSFVTGGADGTIKGWEIGRHSSTFTIRAHPSGVCCMTQYDHSISKLAASGTIIVTGGYDSFIKAWDSNNGELLKEYKKHTGAITCVQVFQNHLVSGSEDKQVRIWDLASGVCKFVLDGHSDPIRCLNVVNGIVFSGSNELMTWDIENGTLIKALGWTQVDCLVTNDNQNFVLLAFDGVVAVIDIQVLSSLRSGKKSSFKIVIDSQLSPMGLQSQKSLTTTAT